MIFKTKDGPGLNRPTNKPLNVGDVFPQQQASGNTSPVNPTPPAPNQPVYYEKDGLMGMRQVQPPAQPPMPPEVAEWFARNGGYPQMQQQQAVVVQQKRGVNHLLHIVLCFVTMGFWIPIYVLVCMFNA